MIAQCPICKFFDDVRRVGRRCQGDILGAATCSGILEAVDSESEQRARQNEIDSGLRRHALLVSGRRYVTEECERIRRHGTFWYTSGPTAVRPTTSEWEDCF